MEGRDLAKSFGVPFFESSAKSRINVEEAFYELVRGLFLFGAASRAVFFHHAADAVSCRSEKSGVKPLRSHLALPLLLPKKKRKKAVATSSRLANILIQVFIAFTH